MVVSIALLIIAFIMICLPMIFIVKYMKLVKRGVETDGVVFDYSSSGGSDFQIKYPIVRFCTTDDIWITEKYSLGISFEIYKKGEKIKIIYDPAKPNFFYIKTSLNYIGSFILILFAIGIAIYSVLRLS